MHRRRHPIRRMPDICFSTANFPGVLACNHVSGFRMKVAQPEAMTPSSIIPTSPECRTNSGFAAPRKQLAHITRTRLRLLAWLNSTVAGVCLLASCESSTDQRYGNAMDRRMQALDYQHNREACQTIPGFSSITPLMGFGVGTGFDGVQPFYNSEALNRMPQSR